MARKAGLAGAFWPDAEQELLLRVALLDDERSHAAWEALEPELDVEHLERGSLALVPLVYERLSARDETFNPKLRGIYRHVWSRNRVAFRSVAEMLKAVHVRDIESIVLGDAALLARFYRRAGARPLYEPTVLVPSARTVGAMKALEAAGWSPEHVGSGGNRWYVRAAPPLELRSALCWRALIELESAPEVAEELWAGREPAQVEDVDTSTLSATHSLLYACCRGARGGRGVAWLADAFTIVREAQDEIDWSQLVSTATRLGSALRIKDALAYLAGTLDAPIPTAVYAEVEALPVSAREVLAYRVGSWGGYRSGNLPSTVAAHLVTTRDESLVRAAVMLPRFVSREWGLDHLSQLPAAIVRRAARRR
jgi:Uncharacterised nucleotidyltransferase